MLICFQILIIVLLFYIKLKKNIIFSYIYFGIFSAISVIFYNILLAPDIAITEAIIGIGVGAIIMIFSLLYMHSMKSLESNVQKPLYLYKKFFILLIFIAIYYILNMLIINLNPINQLSGIAKFYLYNIKKDFVISSIVTSIVVGYRWFDTFFECIVIFIGSVGFKHLVSKN